MIENFFQFLKQSFIIFFVLVFIFSLYLYFNQNSIIYVPILNGIKLPEENPKPYQNPSQLNLMYKELKVKTKDNLTLFGWLYIKKKKFNFQRFYTFTKTRATSDFVWFS